MRFNQRWLSVLFGWCSVLCVPASAFSFEDRDAAEFGSAKFESEVNGSKIVVTATQRLSGAIHSLTWDGQEFIDSLDHGRQLQSAASFDGGRIGEFWAECFNPTEAGSRRDGTGETSSSRLLEISVGTNHLRSKSQMAFWLAPGEKSEGRLAVNKTILSNHTLEKDVTIGYRGYANVLEYRVVFTVPENEHHTLAQFEALTGYMPSKFEKFWKYIPAYSKLEPLDDGPGEQAFPVVLATANGSHAMGVYSIPGEVLGYDPIGYGRFRFEHEKVVKWNCVFRQHNDMGISAGRHSFRLFVIIGTLSEVQTTLATLTTQGQALP